MALKSMKLTPEMQAEETAEFTDPKPPVYPCGLSMHLDDEALQLLGTPRLEIGTLVEITALARVVSGSEYEREGEGGGTEKDECMSIQITDMDMRPAQKRTAKAMYPKSKMED